MKNDNAPQALPLSGGGALPLLTKVQLEDVMMSRGHFSIISASNPYGQSLSSEENERRNAQLEAELKFNKFNYIEAHGKYDDIPERCFIVFHSCENPESSAKALETLAHAWQQESIIHTNQGRHELHFLEGQDQGKVLKGRGYEAHPFVVVSGSNPVARSLRRRSNVLEVPTADRGPVLVAAKIEGE